MEVLTEILNLRILYLKYIFKYISYILNVKFLNLNISERKIATQKFLFGSFSFPSFDTQNVLSLHYEQPRRILFVLKLNMVYIK